MSTIVGSKLVWKPKVSHSGSDRDGGWVLSGYSARRSIGHEHHVMRGVIDECINC
jgi:hypothetical protein